MLDEERAQSWAEMEYCRGGLGSSSELRIGKLVGKTRMENDTMRYPGAL